MQDVNITSYCANGASPWRPVTQFILCYVIVLQDVMFNLISCIMVNPKPLYVLVHTCGHLLDVFHNGRTHYWYSKKAAEKEVEIYHYVDKNPNYPVRVIKFVPEV